MKKLFTAMLAATMVAGMAVTAFAERPSENPASKKDPKESYTASDFGDNDYAVIGAYDEDGKLIKAEKGSKVDSGDKIYFPILISGDEIDDDKHDTKEKGSENMFFADKASEVKNLKASVKDEVGGKYIDSAAIVKKNIRTVYNNLADAKIYCVEVKMADYFKNEETEVEFNILLKKNGKTEYNTNDDKTDFYATFDLGKDSFKLKHNTKYTVADVKYGQRVECKKFKSGDLEIKIGKDTKSVQLDEAEDVKGDTKDITNIYIENDDSIDNAFTFDVKASNQDDLYLELNQDAIKDLAVSNGKADLTFFNFPGKPEFDFTGKATFAVEDDDEDNYFYEIVDGELVESKARYNKEDGVFELRTNKLGSYVISDKELKVSEGKKEENDKTDKPAEATGGDAKAEATTGANGEKGNANTGAADLIGVASALAVVSIAAAGAVALKK